MISEIPTTIGNLQKVEDILFDANSIQSLPTEIGKLQKLVYLELSNNAITEVPSEIFTATKISSLFGLRMRGSVRYPLLKFNGQSIAGDTERNWQSP